MGVLDKGHHHREERAVAVHVIILPLVPSHTQRAQYPVQIVNGALDRRADVDVQDRGLTSVALERGRERVVVDLAVEQRRDHLNWGGRPY